MDYIASDNRELWIVVPIVIAVALVGIGLLIPVLIRRYCLSCCPEESCGCCLACSEFCVLSCGTATDCKCCDCNVNEDYYDRRVVYLHPNADTHVGRKIFYPVVETQPVAYTLPVPPPSVINCNVR